MTTTKCKCCASVDQFIRTHLDPNGTLDGTEDAAEVVSALDETFRDEGGAGVSVEEVADHLTRLLRGRHTECLMVDYHDGYYQHFGAAEVEAWEEVFDAGGLVEHLGTLAGWGDWTDSYTIQFGESSATYFAK